MAGSQAWEGNHCTLFSLSPPLSSTCRQGAEGRLDRSIQIWGFRYVPSDRYRPRWQSLSPHQSKLTRDFC